VNRVIEASNTGCNDCNGAGETCAVCRQIPDNCRCETEHFVECPTCEGQPVEDDEAGE